MKKPEKLSPDQLKRIAEACHIEWSLLEEMLNFGLVSSSLFEENDEMHTIQHIRRIRRLHEDLEVNFPGIEVILQMRSHIRQMQQEMEDIRNEMEKIQEAHEREMMRRLRKAGIFIDID